MKTIFTFFLLLTSISSFAQLYNSSGTTIHVVNGSSLYVGIDFENDGIFQIGTAATDSGELILNAGLDNDGGTLTMRDGVLMFGDGSPNSAGGPHNLIFNDFIDPDDQGSFVDKVKFVEFSKDGGTLNVISGQLGILETFTSSESGILNANDRIALISEEYDDTDKNTAIVPESSGGTVNDIRVQKFMKIVRSPNPPIGGITVPEQQSMRAWHHLTVPVEPSGSINDDWQEGANPQILTPGTPGDAVNPHPGFGMHITNLTEPGFDQNSSGEPSLYIYDNKTNTYSSATSTTGQSLEHAKGYFVLVRSDRSIDLTNNDYANDTDTTLQTTGILQIGDITYTDASDIEGEMLLIGNPYQAPVNIRDILSRAGTTNLDDTKIWAWDPKAGIQPYLGQYVLINFGGSIDQTIPNQPQLPGATVPGSNFTEILQPGQAVFIKKNDPAAPYSIEFKESDKVGKNDLTDIFNDDTPDFDGWLRFGLYQPLTIPFESTAKDGFILEFHDTFSNDVNQLDGSKSFAYFENMAMLVDNTYLSKNSRQLPTNIEEEIPIYIENLRTGEYNFSVELESLSEQLPNGIILWDKYEDTYTELSDQLIVPFNVDTSIPESTASDRFAFVFENTTLSTEDHILDGVTLYPNPVITDKVNIKFTEVVSDKTKVEIFNQLGKRVYSNDFDNNGSEIEVNNLNVLSSGVYLLKVIQDNVDTTFKIIKK